MTNPLKRLVGVDVETFGLDRKEPILEVGVRIFDLDFKTVAQQTVLVWDRPLYRARLDELERDAPYDPTGAGFVLNMHTSSGLLHEAEAFGMPPAQAEQYLLSFCNQWSILGQDPMFGSSIQSDRKWLAHWMPHFEARFSYRNIDVSSIKETIMRYNPELLARLDAMNRKGHRVQADIEDSASEYKWYLDNFMFTDRS